MVLEAEVMNVNKIHQLGLPELIDDPLAFYWVHRPVGTKKYIKYVLPSQQVPAVHSGQLYGPFTRRSLKTFLKEKGLQENVEHAS